MHRGSVQISGGFFMLLLLVKYTAKPGGGEKFVREITASGILNTVRAEDGCEGYDYYFSAENPDTVLLVEKWASAKTAGSASSDSAHGRADEDKKRNISRAPQSKKTVL